jgi:hypothetical protein
VLRLGQYRPSVRRAAQFYGGQWLLLFLSPATINNALHPGFRMFEQMNSAAWKSLDLIEVEDRKYLLDILKNTFCLKKRLIIYPNQIRFVLVRSHEELNCHLAVVELLRTSYEYGLRRAVVENCASM